MSEAKTLSDAEKSRASGMIKEMTGEGAKNPSALDRKRADEIGSSFKNYKKRRASTFKGHF
jgi:C1A family cysteine protease